MAEIEVATFEQLATLMSHLMDNYTSLALTYYNMFYSTTPQDLVIKLYDNEGNLEEYVVPNRAKDFNYTLNGSGSPEGVVSANIGTTYQDTTNGKLYIKQTASGDVTGWTLIGTDTGIRTGNGSPEGVLVENKGTLYIDKVNVGLYIKSSDTGNTGWNLISADTSNLVNKDLTNLSETGEDHFANPSLNNLNNAGNQKFANKEDVNNKVASIAVTSTDTQYPTAKATYTFTQDSITAKTGNLTDLTTTAKNNLVAAINEVNARDPLPTQSGNSGKFLTTNGTTTSWASSLPAQSGNSGKFLTTNGTTASWNYVFGLPIGAVFSMNCTPSYVPDGALPCDGTEYSKTQFSDLWTNYLNIVGTATEPLLKTCTYSEYATALSTYGSCPMFAVDTTNLKFKVPTIKDGAYITQAKSNSELGKSYNESLPNGTFSTQTHNESGAVANCIASGANNPDSTLEIKLSQFNTVFKDNAKVQGDNVRLRYFVQVANGQLNQSQMDWTAWASSLAGKLNTDHSNDAKPYLKVTYVDPDTPTNGYRIWSDGYCEQWGTTVGTGSWGLITINFLKEFNSTDYTFVTAGASLVSSDYSSTTNLTLRGGCRGRYINKTVTSIQTQSYEPTGWRASGYLAEGQY